MSTQTIATTHRRRGGVVVRQVRPGSLADECGLQPGDKIESINGHVIPDSLSFQFNINHPDLQLVVTKADGEVWELEVENDFTATFGVDLEEDPIMLCRNKCIFCFVDQNPRGYRKSLLIKDEDIRLSFLYGNYTTLSSTDSAEEQRIIREKISPLYVSVHATDPEVRVFMLKNKKSGDILQRLRRFADGGIDIHAQIVLCPEINDGEILDRTIKDLAQLHPRLISIAVVPLGITKHRQELVNMTPITDAYCAELVPKMDVVRARFERQYGNPLVFLGDEFYIRGGRPIPLAEAYFDFPQMENGVGMVRRFIDQFKQHMPKVRLQPGLSGTLVTGSLFGSVLTELVDDINALHGTRIRVAAIENDAFGPSLITVAGLVHGRDLMDQLEDRDLGEFVAIPAVMLKDGDDQIMVDNFAPHHLAQKLGVPVVVSGNEATDLLGVLVDWQSQVSAFPDSTRGGVRVRTRIG